MKISKDQRNALIIIILTFSIALFFIRSNDNNHSSLQAAANNSPVEKSLSSSVNSTPSGKPTKNPIVTAKPSKKVTPASYTMSSASSYVATVKHAKTTLFKTLGKHPYLTLDSPTALGSPIVFLVKKADAGWLEVYLPTRPNGSLGWIPQSEVSIAKNPWRVDSTLSKHVLKIYKNGTLTYSFPEAVGKASTPTPQGLFYITERNNLTPKTGAYGPAAIGLSGHSTVYTTFGIGDGDVGIHGTDEDDSVGKSASHGCMRLHNKDIAFLMPLLPWGTPVYVHT